MMTNIFFLTLLLLLRVSYIEGQDLLDTPYVDSIKMINDSVLIGKVIKDNLVIILFKKIDHNADTIYLHKSDIKMIYYSNGTVAVFNKNKIKFNKYVCIFSSPIWIIFTTIRILHN